MPTESLHDEDSTSGQENSAALPGRVILVAAAVMAAAWIAAGSIGLISHPLRHALTWASLAVAVVAAWPWQTRSAGRWATLAAGVVLGLIMTATVDRTVNLLAVAVVAAALARLYTGPAGRAILLTALAATVLAVFGLACGSIPTVWLAADACGRMLGSLATLITGERLSVGAGFGGVDFLVLMAAVYAGWLAYTSPPRLSRALYAAAAILLGHLAYVIVLSYSGRLTAALPDLVLPPDPEITISYLGVWAWSNAVRSLLPWNLPVLAGVIQLIVLGAMFRWSSWQPDARPHPDSGVAGAADEDALLTDLAVQFGPALLAALIPLVTVLAQSESDLAGKTVVAYQKGYLNWLKPEHGREFSPLDRTYGMLPSFVECLGGRFVKSDDLSSDHLAEADVVLLLHPDQPWQPEQLDRLWKFVRGGGSLLVVAEAKIVEEDAESSFNDVLRPTAMRVRYDTTVPAAKHWEHGYQPLAHPATAGVGDCRGRFGLSMGASIRTAWPARPLLVGRFGFSDPGSDAGATDLYQYDPGEKLGDLVLAAEQRLGKGRIVVLGDAACLTNENNARCYPFTGRLLGYLAGHRGSPQSWWRQLLGLLAMVAMVGLLFRRADWTRIATTALVLAGSLTCCTFIVHHTGRVLPDGGHHNPNCLAYIDASHLESYSSDTWHELGLGGLARTLMRNGYLPLMLPELTAERLERAAMLISIGPARRYSAAEREVLRQFVETGGRLICMVGAEEAGASNDLLAAFDFHVPPSPVPPGENVGETAPMTTLKAYRGRYLELDGYDVFMRCYAPWPVECSGEDCGVLKRDMKDTPVIIINPVGAGSVTVIGDTHFASNANLAAEFDDDGDNARFWRWMLSGFSGEVWTPPKPKPAAEPAGEGTENRPPGVTVNGGLSQFSRRGDACAANSRFHRENGTVPFGRGRGQVHFSDDAFLVKCVFSPKNGPVPSAGYPQADEVGQ